MFIWWERCKLFGQEGTTRSCQVSPKDPKSVFPLMWSCTNMNLLRLQSNIIETCIIRTYFCKVSLGSESKTNNVLKSVKIYFWNIAVLLSSPIYGSSYPYLVTWLYGQWHTCCSPKIFPSPWPLIWDLCAYHFIPTPLPLHNYWGPTRLFLG